jgi:hypothetical protein
MSRLAAQDPRRFGTTPGERVAGQVREARDVPPPGSPRRAMPNLNLTMGATWLSFGGTEQAIEQTDYADVSRLRGLVTTGGGVVLGGANAEVCTVERPPEWNQIFDQAAYAVGAGYCILRVDVTPAGDVRVVACLTDPGIVSLDADSWVSLAGIEWVRA